MSSISDRLKAIKNSLTTAISDIRASLLEKGVSTTDTFKISDAANSIREVVQADFEFYFNFQDVDQFGNPRGVRKGHKSVFPSESLNIYQYMEELYTQTISFTEQSVPENLNTKNHGLPSTLIVNINSQEPADLTVTVLEDFNEQQL